MLFPVSTGVVTGMSDPGKRLEELIKTAVNSSGGQYTSVTDFVTKAGAKGRGTFSNWKRRVKADPGARMDAWLFRNLASQLGFTWDQLDSLVYPPSKSSADPFPNRTAAVQAARDLQLPEEAIRAVLSEQPQADGSRWYWFKRIEAEAMRFAPVSSGKRF